jgi:translation elongation factor aEF-1 beta
LKQNEGGFEMGFVVITYKIFPTDIISDFGEMKKKVESNLPTLASVHGYGEELVAYGLKALLVQVKFPEDKTGLLEEFEKKIESMEGVSQIQTLMVRRISR